MIEPTNINDALLPITINSWIMGIDIIEYPLGKPQRILSIIYSNACVVIICASIYIHLLRFSTIYSHYNNWNEWFPIMFYLGSTFICIIGIISSKTNAYVSI